MYCRWLLIKFKEKDGKVKMWTPINKIYNESSVNSTIMHVFSVCVYIYIYIVVIIPSNLYKLSLTLIDTGEGHLLIENFVNILFVTSLSVSLHNLLDFYTI
jgi:hypothetical protein